MSSWKMRSTTPLLRDKCDELDDTRFHQQELYDEWEKLAEEQETFENEGE